jgi:hypothetical protein
MISMRARVGALAAGALVLACAALVGPADRPADDARVTLGIFDSRAVAIAYANSERFETRMAGLLEDLDEARAAGDEARVAELEAFGPQLQKRLHEQGFSTAPVDDILEHIEEELPAIAKRAGVDVIVSKWDLVWRDPAAECVDVTGHLVDALQPDEKGRQWAMQIVDQEPIPEDQLDHDH